MPGSKAVKESHSQRYDRYKAVIDLVVGHDAFELDLIKESCSDEQPAFITRVVKDLVKSGWLVCESEAATAYRWNRGRGEFSASRWLDEKLFGSQIKTTPEGERPRERLLARGVESLEISQLLAILIRSGRPGESAVQAGEKISKAFDGRLAELPQAGRAELKDISAAIDVTAFCQIKAGIELGRRVAESSGSRPLAKITSSDEAMKYCRAQFARLAHDGKQEEFHVVCLDTKNQVIQPHQITVGTLDASLVHPREVFRVAIKDAASSIILFHNHPSGDPTPSREDLQVTSRLEEAGKTVGINVLDHIILGRHGATSIREYRNNVGG